jgi:hypothetical protein
VASNVFQCSQSKISAWRRCKYYAFLRYIEGLRKRVKDRPLQFGTLAHTVLEVDAGGGQPFKALSVAVKEQKLFAQEREQLTQTADEVRVIMRDYFEFWDQAKPAQQLTPIKRKGKSAEHQIFVEIAKGIQLEVRLDLLATRGSGGVFLVDHKTFRQKPTEDHRWRSLQANIYKKATDIEGIKLDGMCWNYIRSKPPTFPQLKKNGELSLKRLDTLPEALKTFGKAQKIEIPERMMSTALANRSSWFMRDFMPFRKTTVEAMATDFIESARDMAQNLGVQKAKTIDRHCDWCEMEAICRAELQGGDVKYIKTKEYTTREQRKKEEAELASAD